MQRLVAIERCWQSWGCWPSALSWGLACSGLAVIHRPAAAGLQDPTRLVSATLICVQPLECEEADPGVPSSICIRVEARLADGKQVRFSTPPT